MLGNTKQLPPIIKIRNFPSRDKVVNDFKSFLTERRLKEDFKIVDKTNNQLLFYVNSPSVAYKYNERYNNKILANPLFSNSSISIISKDNNMGGPFFRKNYSYVKPRLLNSNKNNNNKKFLNKSVSVISEYERKHWADIKEKACIIDNDSPFMDSITKEYLEKKKNQKKWVVKKKFENIVGKASSYQNYSFHDIKNYVMRTPSLPPVLYQFREKVKNKWVGKADFQLY